MQIPRAHSRDKLSLIFRVAKCSPSADVSQSSAVAKSRLNHELTCSRKPHSERSANIRVGPGFLWLSVEQIRMRFERE